MRLRLILEDNPELIYIQGSKKRQLMLEVD